MRNALDAQIKGFVLHDPKLKITEGGRSVCEFSVAMNQYSNSEEIPKISYLDIETWGKLAEICSSRINKGKLVIITGELRQDRWEKGGKVCSRLKLIGNRLSFPEYRNILETHQGTG